MTILMNLRGSEAMTCKGFEEQDMPEEVKSDLSCLKRRPS